MDDEYDDEYPTCARTYATLRIYPGYIDPAEVTERLGIEPTSWQRRGEVVQRNGRTARTAPIHGWFLESRGLVESKDFRRHLDWILDRVMPRAEAIRSLQAAGCRMDVACYWHSQEGQGGPTVSPSQMGRLAELELELWFDLY